MLGSRLASRQVWRRSLQCLGAMSAWRHTRQIAVSAALRGSWGNGTPITLPALSPTMEEGSIGEWNLKEGERFDAGSVLCVVNTDKAGVDFEMQDEGYLAKILVPAGSDGVKVGQPIAVAVEDEEDLEAAMAMDYSDALSSASTGSPSDQNSNDSSSTSTDSSPSPQDAHSAAAGGSGGAVFGSTAASPAASALIRSHGLDVSGARGSGKRGMLTKGDVLAMLGHQDAAEALARMGLVAPTASQQAQEASEGQSQAPTPAPAGASAPSAGSHQASSGSPLWVKPSTAGSALDLAPALGREGASFEDSAPSTMRKVIASRLTESKGETPHFYTVMECSIDAMLAMRKQLKAAGVAASVNDFVIKAAAMALRAVPEVNCSFDPKSQQVRENEAVDVSVAVATDGGLITPIIKGADGLGLGSIGGQVKDLATRARKGKLLPEEYQGGTFSVSNLGMFGISTFTAVINPPQAAILAVGQGEQQLVYPELGAVEAQQEVDDIARDAVMRTGSAAATDRASGGAPGSAVSLDDLDAMADAEAGGVPGEDGQGRWPEAEVATKMSVQLSADRRVVDEATAGRFLQAFRAYCEQPALLVA